MISPVRALLLTAIWVFLWGDLSVANVLSGLVVSGVVLVMDPHERRRRSIRHRLRARPLATVHLLGHVVMQLVRSNALMARAIMTGGRGLRAGIVACELHTESEAMVTFLASVLALTPGTMPVEVRTDPPTIRLHVLQRRDPATSRAAVDRLEQLAIRAFGSAADVDRMLERTQDEERSVRRLRGRGRS